MSPLRQPGKKDPRYLEDITYSVATQPVNKNDPFASSLFMGRYEERTLMEMLDRAGVIGILHRRGYRDLVVNVVRQDDYTSRLYVNFDSDRGESVSSSCGAWRACSGRRDLCPDVLLLRRPVHAPHRVVALQEPKAHSRRKSQTAGQHTRPGRAEEYAGTFLYKLGKLTARRHSGRA
jgi:hypothetical protein